MSSGGGSDAIVDESSSGEATVIAGGWLDPRFTRLSVVWRRGGTERVPVTSTDDDVTVAGVVGDVDAEPTVGVVFFVEIIESERI